MLLRPLPVPSPGELVNLSRARAEAGLAVLQTRRATATTSSATRCSATSRSVQTVFTGIAAHVSFGANLAYAGPDDERRRAARLRQLLPGARPAAGARPPARRRTTTAPSASRVVVVLSHDYWTTRFGARPGRAQRDDHRQRPDADDRRRRAARASTARRSARGRECSCRSRCAALMEPGLEGLREPPQLLGLPLRAAEARRVDRAGARGDQRASTARSSTTSRRRCRRA